MPVFRFSSPRGGTVAVRRDEGLFSVALGRVVRLDVVLPPGYDPAALRPYPVLYLNDGQDLQRLRLPATLNRLYRQRPAALRPFVLVAVHAADRLQEYGVAARPDYLGRGARAGRYTQFVIRELLPYVEAHYRVSADPAVRVVAGMSLGGLTAFDLAWHHPEAFRRAGAFSGSFWWRRRALHDGYTDADRLMHGLVRAQTPHPEHQFWLQTGTDDEKNDRNHNGIIDSIEDTLDLIAALERQGVPGRAIRYVEVPGGRHHQDTWGEAMPNFLAWAFGENVAQNNGSRRFSQRSDAARHVRRRPRGAEKLNFRYLAPPTRPAMNPASLTRPEPGTYLDYYQGYIDRVPAGADPLDLLRQQAAEMHRELARLTDAQARAAYAPGKWSIKELLLHMVDAERIFAYRALRFARADRQPLAGLDENEYAAHSQANERAMSDLLAEYHAVRAATLALFGSFTAEQLDRQGTANNGPISVRALLYILPGHELHHLAVLRERYFPALPPAEAGASAQHQPAALR